MFENVTTEALLRLLSRLPTTTAGYRIDPATGKSEWIYFSPGMADLFGLPEAELRVEPLSLLKRMEPGDAARLQEQLTASLQTLNTMVWSGRIVHPSGTVRWIETRTAFERDPDGMIAAHGMATDVTERKEAEQAQAVADAAHERSNAMHRAVIESLPVGIIVMEPDGTFPIYNRAAHRYTGRVPEGHGGDLTGAVGIFQTDGITPFPNDQLPMVRALAGEEAPEIETIIRNGSLDGDCRVRATGSPIRDGAGKIIAAMVALHDITGQRELEEELRRRNEQLAASEEAKTVLIERLRLAIDELSNPILEIWDDVLAMPIIGIVDSRRTADMVQRLLAEVARTQASFVIIDLTGVEIIDTRTADHLMKLVRKVEVVGARCVLTGIRPAVAETLVDIGVDFGNMTTLRNLKHGLREALRSSRREREGLRDDSPEAAVDAPPRRLGR